MNKEQFLAALRRLLRELPTDELERILEYYREMIEDKVENGQTEEEAVRGLGDIRALAQKILAENPNRRPRNVGKIILIAVLSLLGMFVVAGIVIGVAGWNMIKSKWPGSAASASYEYKIYTAKPDGIGTINVSADNKAVIFQPWDANQIQIKYAVDQYQHYNFHSTGGALSVENTEGNGHWINEWGWNGNDAPSITIMLPKNFSGNISVETTNSYIKAGDFKNLKSIHCETTNSAIDVTNLSAQNIEFRTQNAAINLQNVTASAKIAADTQNAKIGLENISAPNISLNTQNGLVTGTIRGREDDYTVEAHTTNASSNLKNRTGGSKKLSVETTNAIIDVKFEK